MSTATSSPPPIVSKSTTDYSIYELRFRKGGIIQSFHFKWTDKESAISKAKEYCEKKGLKFIYVNEWLQDIQKMIDFEADEGYRR